MPNIRDVAKASGVSHQTVSEVFNRPSVVKASTRERVLLAAGRLNYHPSAVARGLSSKRMNMLGIVFSSRTPDPFASEYYTSILSGITLAATEAGQSPVLFTGDKWLDAEQGAAILSDKRCDGLILIGPFRHVDLWTSLTERETPLVLINSRWEHPQASYIDVDDTAAMRGLTTFLLEQGHRRIALLGDIVSFGYVRRRLEGYHQALADWAITADPALVQTGTVPDDQTGGTVTTPGPHQDFEQFISTSLTALLDLPPARRPTALVCVNDEIAIVALSDLEQRGLRVPEDLSVTGFDGLAATAKTRPPLTTARQPLRELGQRTVAILLRRIADKTAVVKELLPTELVVRASTIPLASDPIASKN